MLDTVGNIIDRMSELKGLASQDPMKSDQDRSSYNNEFKDLQVQLYSISQQGFNGVSLFANYTTEKGGTAQEALFNAADQDLDEDHTITIYTSAAGSAGSKVSVHKSLLLSALTVKHGQVFSRLRYNKRFLVSDDNCTKPRWLHMLLMIIIS